VVFAFATHWLESRIHMQGRKTPQLAILWEHVDDPNVDQLLRRVMELILNDPQKISPEAGFDTNPLKGLNEKVPVENVNQSQPNA